MLFTTFSYFIFLPFVVFVSSIPKVTIRKLFLLIASLYFYAHWKLIYLPLLLFSISIDWFLANKMDNDPKYKRWYLIGSLTLNFGLLFFFKYLNYILFTFFSINRPFLQTDLPIGISFYTFQTVSYGLDVYWGRQKAEKNFLNFALFVSFFPQLIAGPIEKYSKIFPQLNKKYELNTNDLKEGFYLFCKGFFKKVAIADSIGRYVSYYFANLNYENGPGLFFSLLFFAIQMYCDFSGYADMARGSAKYLGINLSENFDRPFQSTTITEFWRRFHITLSIWFRDYLFTPLLLLKVKRYMIPFILTFIFICSGLWHGAGTQYFIWGLLHGIVVSLEFILARKTFLSKSPVFLKRIYVYLVYSLTLVFFRAKSYHDAIDIIHYINNSFYYPEYFFKECYYSLIKFPETLVALILVPYVIYFPNLWKNKDSSIGYYNYLKWAHYSLLTYATLFLSKTGPIPFIYFQF